MWFPLIGVDTGESEMIDVLVYARKTKLRIEGQSSNVANERAVQTRQQVKKEAASMAKTAKKRMKLHVRSVAPESITLSGNFPITNNLPVVEDVHSLQMLLKNRRCSSRIRQAKEQEECSCIPGSSWLLPTLCTKLWILSSTTDTNMTRKAC